MAGQGVLSRERPRRQRPPGESRWLAAVFLAPALILLTAFVVYPLIYTIVRSLYDDGPAGSVGSFAWFDNYKQIFTDPNSQRALRNNVIWVVVAPTLVTMFGLAFAVLTERVRWSTAFKTVLFMPLAISFLASGITFELIYADQPSRGLANTVTVAVHDTFRSNEGYPNLHPRQNSGLTGSAADGYVTDGSTDAQGTALVPMTGLDLRSPPGEAEQAVLPTEGTGLRGVVWNDCAVARP